jgi:cell division protein FtsQ
MAEREPPASPPGATADATDVPAWRRRLRTIAIGTGVAGVLLAPWWGPPLLSTFDFFHVRRVEFDGLRYADPDALMAHVAIDTTASVWQPLEPIAERVRTHPMITEAIARRRLPSTLVLEVVERTPVALVPGERGLVAVDAAGDVLPIDPAGVPIDAPVASSADVVLLGLLDRIRLGAPALWLRLSQARVDGNGGAGRRAAVDRAPTDAAAAGGDSSARDSTPRPPAVRDVRLVLDRVTLRTRTDVTVARLGDIFPVEADLARRRLRAVELDLRFRDQVIARLP